MELKVWRQLIQILSFRNDVVSIIKPFFFNLNRNTILNQKYDPFLNSLSKYHLELLYNYKILPKDKYAFLIYNNGSIRFSTNTKIEEIIHEIIEGDNVEKLQILIREKDFKEMSSINKPFNEVEKMKIPLLQYCVIKQAIKCFKFLLINGIGDPTITMQEQNPMILRDSDFKKITEVKRYEWDCMATAIYFGKTEIETILEEQGFEKGNNLVHLEAAILSYRSFTMKTIIASIEEQNDQSDQNDQNNQNNEFFLKCLNIALSTSSKNNYIRAIEFFINKGADVNLLNMILN